MRKSRALAEPSRARGRNRIQIALIALLLTAFGTVTGFRAGPGDAALARDVTSLPDLACSRDATATLPVLPNPQAELETAVETFAAVLGVPYDAGAALGAAALTDEAANNLSFTLNALLACHQTSAAILGGLTPEELVQLSRGEGSLDPAAVSDLRACAEAVVSSAVALRATATLCDGGATVNLWPVLFIDRSGRDDTYIHDYVLLIDCDGSDVYDNNAGGNLLDVRRGPEGSPAPEHARAQGCQKIPDVIDGKCVVSAALLLEMNGNDIYGLREAPDPAVDGACTTETLVRRFFVQGAGFVGTGVLMDGGGNDTYIAKLLSQGGGHVGGVGILSDGTFGRGSGSGNGPHTSNDAYLGIRGVQGAGLVAGGLGILCDEGGNDTFDFYMPAGGIINDQLVCDDRARNYQGAGTFAGEGVFDNLGGSDVYRAAGLAQGSGTLGGTGSFRERGGTDLYSGVPGRGNNTVAGSIDPTGVGVFRDCDDPADAACAPGAGSRGSSGLRLDSATVVAAPGRVAFDYALPEEGPVELLVYDVTGRQVATLEGSRRARGEHRAVWDARGRASGIYYIRLRMAGVSQTKVVLLLH